MLLAVPEPHLTVHLTEGEVNRVREVQAEHREAEKVDDPSQSARAFYVSSSEPKD